MTTITRHRGTEAGPVPAPRDRAETAASAVTVDAVTKSYGSRRVLRGISLSIQAGEVFGILGPNGAGKTTLVESLVGLRRPDSGTITVLGMNPTEHRHEFTSRVSVQPQDATLFESIRVREALELFASMYPDPLDVDEVVEQIGLGDSTRQLVRKLSGGQRRRLLLGVAMIGSPELIVLDEPSAGLDPAARRSLWQVVDRMRERGTTVLLTTHHMDEATALCDRVAFVVDGQVRALGTPDDLVTQLAGDQHVAFDTAVADASELDGIVRSLHGHDEVTDVTTAPNGRGHRVKVTTTSSDAVLALVAASPAWQARGITVDHGDLENVFLTVAAASGSPDEPDAADAGDRSTPPRRLSRRNRKEA